MKHKGTFVALGMVVFILASAVVFAVGVALITYPRILTISAGCVLMGDAVGVTVVGIIVFRNWVDEEGQGPQHLAATLLRSRFHLVTDKLDNDLNHRAFLTDLPSLTTKCRCNHKLQMSFEEEE